MVSSKLDVELVSADHDGSELALVKLGVRSLYLRHIYRIPASVGSVRRAGDVSETSFGCIDSKRIVHVDRYDLLDF